MLDGKDEYLIANLRDHIERLKYTFKTQQKAADKYDLCEKIRIIFGAVLTATASGTFIAMLFEAIGRQTAGGISNFGNSDHCYIGCHCGGEDEFCKPGTWSSSSWRSDS